MAIPLRCAAQSAPGKVFGSGADSRGRSCQRRAARLIIRRMISPSNISPSGAPSGGIAALKREIGHLQHELRRVQDGLERNPTRDLQARARQLRDNIALCERELAVELNRAAQRRDGE